MAECVEVSIRLEVAERFADLSATASDIAEVAENCADVLPTPPEGNGR